jgi:hypothetical protein
MITSKLIELGACSDAKEWAKDKSWQEIFTTCHRGDWLLWLFRKVNTDDLKKLTLAKAHCANTVRHLMKDDRSKNAIDVAIKFGNGEAALDELNAAAAAAAAYAAADADADAADAAAYAAAAADAYAAAAADAYAADAAAAADDDAAYAARKKAREENRMLTANICRQYLPIEIWNIVDEN